MRRLLREPLTHFVILGLGALIVYQSFGGGDAGSREIVVSPRQIETLRATWTSQWNRPPSEDELRGLVDAWVREEILYREALALGLDRNDTIVRRRLAQKMEFLAAGGGDEAEPGDAELADFLADNAERFRIPGQVSFEQVYVSPDQRGANARDDALAILVRLRAGADPASVGDHLMLPQRHDGVSVARLDQLFGGGFGEALATVPSGEWSGPIESGYGLHLVRVEHREPPRAPALDEVRDTVRLELEAARRDERLEAFHRALRERYEVEIAELSSPPD